MPIVSILCGKVASGKTTYANRLKEQQKAMILSCDDLMLELFDSCLGEKHDDTVRRCSSFLNAQAVELVKIGVPVILDFGHWTVSDRAVVRNYFKSRNIETQLIYFDIPEGERISRLKKRNESLAGATKRVYMIDDELLSYLDSKFQEPTPDEVDIFITE